MAEVLGTQWLTDHVNEKCGTSYTPFQIRALLRKLGDRGVINRKQKGQRYAFKNERDSNVKAIVKYVSSGEAEADRKKELEAIQKKKDTPKTKATNPKKEEAAAEEATPKKKAAPAKKKKPVAAEPEDDIDELVEIDD